MNREKTNHPSTSENQLSPEQSRLLDKARSSFQLGSKLIAEGQVAAGRKVVERATYQYALILREAVPSELERDLRVARAQGFEILAKTAPTDSKIDALLKGPRSEENQRLLKEELATVEKRVSKFYQLSAAELGRAAKVRQDGELFRIAGKMSKLAVETNLATYGAVADVLAKTLRKQEEQLGRIALVTRDQARAVDRQWERQGVLDKGFSYLTGTNELFDQQRKDLTLNADSMWIRKDEMGRLAKMLELSRAAKGGSADLRLLDLKGALGRVLMEDLTVFRRDQIADMKRSAEAFDKLAAATGERIDTHQSVATTARNVAFVAGVTLSTGGIGGAAMAAGWGTTAVVTSATVGGTATGVLLSTSGRTIANEIRVLSGERRGTVYKNFKQETVEDAKSSALSAVATASGMGVARGLASVASTTTARVGVGAAAGATGGGVSHAGSEALRYRETVAEFLGDERNARLSAEERQNAYKALLAARGLTFNHFAKEQFKAMAFGALGGSIGAKAALSAEAATSRSARVLIHTAEQGANGLVGVAAALPNGVTPQEVTQEVGNLIVAGLQGKIGSKVGVGARRTPSKVSHEERTRTEEVISEAPASSREEIIPVPNGVRPSPLVGDTTRRFALNSPTRNFLRNTKQIEVSSEFKEANRQAAEVFERRIGYRGEDELSLSEFRAILDESHRAGVYHGKSDNPGVARTKTLMVKGGQMSPKGIPSATRPEAVDYLEAVFRDHGELLGRPSEKMRIRGIPDDAAPLNDLSATQGLRGWHAYPKGEQLRPYFERGRTLLQDILAGIRTRQSPEQIRDLIGEYYHVMANARPYDQVNNSIFMAQANVLLRMTKHEGIPHHHLDHLFQRVGTEQALVLWRLALEKKLKPAHEYGISIR